MREFRNVDGSKLLQISWVKTRVPRHKNLCIDYRTSLTIAMIRNSHEARSGLEPVGYVRWLGGFTDTEQQSRLQDQDSAFLLSAPRHHLAVLCLKQSLNRIENCVSSFKE
jgi:hypothetical protein